MPDRPSLPIALLNSPGVFERSEKLFRHALAGDLQSLRLDMDRIGALVARVRHQIAESYPDFQIPPYGCWRFFEVGNVDRWGMIAGARGFSSANEMLLSAGDLAVLCAIANVALDPAWTFYEEVTGRSFRGQEGKALAVLSMFAAGVFSAHPDDPLRADAHALIRVEPKEVIDGFQLDPDVDAPHAEMLAALFNRLGEATGMRPDLFTSGDETRPGNLLVQLALKADEKTVIGSDLLDVVLDGCAVVWQGGAVIDDVILGDTWRHPALLAELVGNGEVPFHLPAIEIASSFVEPLAWAGVTIDVLDTLPALANLEHIAMFVDAGVLVLSPAAEIEPLEAMIEVRGGTLALLNELARELRTDLDVSADQLPLSCIQEGGTLRLGREILMENAALAEKLSKILGSGGVFWLPFKA
ncbi:DUF1688 family protein [Roseibium sp.]|uniref:DUF1688 family protein n=1 Tax=Roseibium sp. TaxID=1936156 RepID=UPI003A96973A